MGQALQSCICTAFHLLGIHKESETETEADAEGDMPHYLDAHNAANACMRAYIIAIKMHTFRETGDGQKEVIYQAIIHVSSSNNRLDTSGCLDLDLVVSALC